MGNDLIITPGQFKDALKSVLGNSEMEKRLFDYWNNSGDYTDVWKKNEKSVYAKLAEKLGLVYSLEYCRIDAVFYRESAACRYSQYATHYNVSFLSAIMEHENDPASSHHEMNVLLRHNASLKVLVTYPTKNTPGEELLGKYADQIRTADVYKEFDRNQRCFVVFGIEILDSRGKLKRPLTWEYHLYKNGKFEEL